MMHAPEQVSRIRWLDPRAVWHAEVCDPEIHEDGTESITVGHDGAYEVLRSPDMEELANSFRKLADDIDSAICDARKAHRDAAEARVCWHCGADKSAEHATCGSYSCERAEAMDAA